ncbi:hypothetical protein Sste5346_010285 [Sporothrix stenoceras]|uniref:Pre-rRNA processing protein n=1 Tax=Sporothrix stenoceras TaxID=5173 RepID=A0ABR3YG97_9PEZI
MAGHDDDQSPLLGSEPERDAATTSAAETTPLLAGDSSSAQLRYDGSSVDDDAASHHTRVSGSDGASIRSTKKSGRRWPSIVAILILGLASVSIIVLAYFVPAAVEEYAKRGVVIEPTNLSLESITTDGVRARIQANFRLDGSRVKNDQVRRIGQTATWIIRKLGTEQTTLSVYLPDLSNVLLGSAQIPPLVIDLVDGHTTAIDFVADLVPGDAEGIRSIANQWLEGRLGSVRLRGKADIALKTGLIPLGTHTVSESLVFEANQLPDLPKYDIDRIIFQEIDIPGKSDRAMGAELSISAYNNFPVQVDIPPLAFEIFVPNCNALDPVIQVADAITAPVALRPKSTVHVDVNGTVQELPDSLTALCPGSKSSPLDLFLKQYLNGDDAVVYVRGKKQSLDGTPDWISDILSSITVPVPFPGRTFDNLIKEFSLTDVKFTLPDPLADPDEPESNPTVSGTILVTAALPSQMNFAINVTSVRANADVFYHGDKLGELNLDKWQAANSTMTKATPDHGTTLEIQSRIDNAPLNVTDGDVLTEVIQKLLFGGDHVNLKIKALVDIRVDTILGQLELKDVPAEGKVPVKRPNRVWNIRLIGTASAENLNVVAGNNTNLVVGATWDPSLGGETGLEIGRNLLSEFVSGFNVSLTVRAYRGSIPLQPILGDALSKFNFTLQAPRLALPGSGDDDDTGDNDGKEGTAKHSFIRDATFHVFSSTASFILASPLVKNTLYIEDAKAARGMVP